MSTEKLAEALHMCMACLDAETNSINGGGYEAYRLGEEALAAHAQAQKAEPVYQMRNGSAWFDIPYEQYDRINSGPTRILYTAPPADAKDAEAKWLIEHCTVTSTPECDALILPFRLCGENGFDLRTAIRAAMAREGG